jgi:hypothetical protein
MAAKATQQRQNFWQDSIETGGNQVGKQLSSLSKDTIRSMWEDFFKAAAKKNIPEQILSKGESGEKHTIQSATLVEGQVMSLSREVKETKKVTTEHLDYFRREVQYAEVKKTDRNEYEQNQRIDTIKHEIKQLIKAQKEMEIAFKEVAEQVTVSQTPTESGQYYENFFTWVLLTIRNARKRVDESKTWLAVFASKKSQKQYWSQAKSKGTSFTMHHDRAVATQTG